MSEPIFPAFISREGLQGTGFEAYGTTIREERDASDWFEFLTRGRDWLVVLAEFSGRAPHNAPLLDDARVAFGSFVREGPTPPDALLERVNRHICRRERQAFAGGTVLVWDAERRALSWSSFGGDAIIVRAAHGRRCEAVKARGIVLGLTTAADAPFARHELVLAPGDVVVLVSDGVHRHADDRVLMEVEELRAAVATHGDRSPRELVEALVGDVVLRAGGAWLTDDATIVAVKKL